MTANLNHSPAPSSRALSHPQILALALPVLASLLLGVHSKAHAQNLMFDLHDPGNQTTSAATIVKVALQIDKQGNITVNGKPVELRALLSVIPKPKPITCEQNALNLATKVIIYVKPDYHTSYDAVVNTMTMPKNAGYDHLVLVNPSK